MLIQGISLMFSCLLAATIIPFSSEAILIAYASESSLGVWQALAWAVTGNVAGTVVNYAAGRWGGEWLIKKLGIKPEKLEMWHERHKKYERWLWAANWVPIIGDPITIFAGIVKPDFREFLLWVVLLRSARYLVVILFWEQFFI